MGAPYRLPVTFRPLCERELVIERGGDSCHEWKHMETRVDWVGQGEPIFELIQRCHRGRVEMRRLLHRNEGDLVCDLTLQALVGNLGEYRLQLDGQNLELDAAGAVRFICREGKFEQMSSPVRAASASSSLPPLEELYSASVALLQMEGRGGEVGRALLAAGDVPGAGRCLDDSAESILLLEEMGERCSEEAAAKVFEEGSGRPIEIRALRAASRMHGSKVFAAQAEKWDRDLVLSGPETLEAFIHGVRPITDNDLARFDGEHRVETRRGTSFRPAADATYGTALLTLKRAHVEFQLGHRKEGRRLLHLVASQAGNSLLIPERLDAGAHFHPLFQGMDLGECPDLRAHAQFVRTFRRF
jgi:hypothetical protein